MGEEIKEEMPYGFTVTAKGRAFLAKQIAGAQIKISRVMMGSGKVPEGTNPALLTDLKPITKLTETITKLDDTCQSLEERMEKFENHNHES